MSETISAYIIGRLKLGEVLEKEDPETQAKFLMETFPQIKGVDIITGEWDLLIYFEVKDMEEYYHVAWGIAKHLERGWGCLVAKSIKRSK